jgi:hypothetical protein
VLDAVLTASSHAHCSMPSKAQQLVSPCASTDSTVYVPLLTHVTTAVAHLVANR